MDSGVNENNVLHLGVAEKLERRNQRTNALRNM